MKKSVSFKNTELDLQIMKFAETKMNFSIYVKELILNDMMKTHTHYGQSLITEYSENDEEMSIEW